MVLAVVLSVLEAFVALALSVVVVVNSLNVAGCAGRVCNLGLGQASIYVTPIAGVTVLILSIGAEVILGVRGRSSWVVPAIGLAVIVIGFIIAMMMNTTALTPSS